MRVSADHVVVIRYSPFLRIDRAWTVHCQTCGKLSGGPYETEEQAENRKAVHERGDDAGKD